MKAPSSPKHPGQLDLFHARAKKHPKKAVMHSDGASSGNPGPSGIGVVIECEGKTFEFSEPIGRATNNIAEYAAFLRGLEEAIRLGAESLDVRLDSELLVRQINGIYKVKNENLKPLYEKSKALLGSFKEVSVSHVPRESNKRADALARKASGESAGNP